MLGKSIGKSGFALAVTLNVAGAILLNFSPALNAQVVASSATVRGVVTDPTGAVVPGATVTLDSTQRRFKVDTKADEAGRYRFPTLLPGEYKVAVTSAGFKSADIAPFTLNAGQGITLNVELVVGNTADRIDVTGAAPLLQTENGNLGSVIESQMIVNLPLLNRNWTTLQLTLPGQTNNFDWNGATWNNVNGLAEQPNFFGQSGMNTNYTMDGTSNNGPLMNTIVTFPPPETIQEISMQVGETTSAAGGWSSGANLNIVTKGGSNRLHGDLWEQFRHDKMDAKEYFNSEKGVYRFSQFGAALGGPVVIPKLLKKDSGVYFYTYYEGVRFRRPFAIQGFVPDPKVFQGDFSDVRLYPQNKVIPIYDPLTTQIVGPDVGATSRFTRQPFAGNIIPPSRVDKAAQYWFTSANLPGPNRPLDIARGTNYINNTPSRRKANNFSGRLDKQWGKHNTFGRYTKQIPRRMFTYLYPDDAQSQDALSNQTSISDTWTITPTLFVTNRFGRASSGVLIVKPTLQNEDTLAERLGTLTAFPEDSGCKMWPSLSFEGANFGTPRHGQAPNCEKLNGSFGPELTHSWNTDVQKIRGAHTISVGFSWTRVHTQEGAGGNRGNVSFHSRQTSNDATQTGNGAASFLLGYADSASRTFNSRPATGRSFGMGTYVQDNWRVNSKLTLNFGLRWDFAQLLKGDRTGTWVWDQPGTQPFGGNITLRDKVNGYPIYYLIDSYNPITKQEGNAPRGVYPRHYKNFSPRLGFAYQFMPKTVFRGGFAIFYNLYGRNGPHRSGNNGWPWTQTQDVPILNRPFVTVPTWANPFTASLAPLPDRPILPTQVPNSWYEITEDSKPGYTQSWDAAIQRQITSSMVLEFSYYGSHSIRNPNGALVNAAFGPGTDPIKNRRPFPEFDNTWGSQRGTPSWYHGGIAKIEKRWSNNLTFNTSLTWSKQIEYGGNTTDYDREYHRAVGRADNTLRWVASGVYAIPGKTNYRALNVLVSGWTTSAILQRDGGFPYPGFLGFDQSNTGGELNRPNLIGDPNLKNPQPAMWVNKAAFIYPAFGTRGNFGYNAVRADDGFQIDYGIHKKFPLPKEGAWAEFKVDAYNLTNTPTFGAPRSNFDGALGIIPEMRGLTTARKIMLELKIHF